MCSFIKEQYITLHRNNDTNNEIFLDEISPESFADLSRNDISNIKILKLPAQKTKQNKLKLPAENNMGF